MYDTRAPALPTNRFLDQDPPTATAPLQQQATRSFAYAALAQLAERMPALVLGRDETMHVAGRFFTALSVESPSVVSGVRESMPVLIRAVAAHLADASNAQLHGLLLDAVAPQRSDASRMAAVQWARRVFPFANLGRWHSALSRLPHLVASLV